MRFKIVADSSSNVLSLPQEDFVSVPLKIRAEKEYVDSLDLDVRAMVDDFKTYKGKSGSSCPNVGEWLEAFGDGECIFGITVSKHLSGSYNAARQAAETYLEEHPDRKVFIFDSLSAGPGLMLIHDKIRECESKGMDFDATCQATLDYQNHTHTLFSLESMNNLAHNGRISPAIAKLAGMLGIRVVGDAKGGTLALVHKPRGLRKSTQTMVQVMKEQGFQNGNTVRISHCFAQEAMEDLRQAILSQFPEAKVIVEPTTALCSFYAEEGGVIVAYEGNFNTHNSNLKF